MEESIVGEKFMRTLEAAQYCGLSKSSFEKYRLLGCGPKYVRAGRRIILYDVEALDEWLRRNQFQSTSEYVDATGK